MRSAAFSFKAKGFPSFRRHVVGASEILVLKNKYDPDQEWLPFMIGTIFEADEPRTETAKQRQRDHEDGKLARDSYERRRISPYVEVPEEYRTLHRPADGRQRSLPFEGHWKISNKDLHVLQESGLECFERTAEGKICTFRFTPSDREAIEAWCQINASGFYNITKSVATFAREIDAVAAKLAFY